MPVEGKHENQNARQDVSLDQIRDLLASALRAQNEKHWLREVYPSYCIFEDEETSKNYRVAWSLLEGDVQVGSEPVEVERQWVEARMAEQAADESVVIDVRMAKPNPEGTEWEVVICEPGFTKNGWYNPPEVLKAAAGLFEGVDVNIYEFPETGAVHIPEPLFDLKKLLVKNKAGWLDAVRYVAGRGLVGIVHFLDHAKWIGQNMLQAMSENRQIYGLSYDAIVKAAREAVQGKEVWKSLEFRKVDSLDIVTRPAAGGKFNRAVASMPAQTKEDPMKEKLWKMIQEKRPDLLNGKEIEKLSDQEVEALARMAMEPPGPPASPGNDNFATKDDLAVFRCGMALERKLGGSDLPEPAKARVRKQFEGRAFQDEDLDKSIADEKDYLAQMAAPPESDPVPGSRIVVGVGSIEKVQMAVDRTFGLSKADVEACARMARLDGQPFFTDMRSVQDYSDFDNVPAFEGLRHIYTFLTGDHEVTGRFDRRRLPAELRGRMDVTSSTFSYVLGNTLGRRLVSGYKEIDFNEGLLISIKKSVKDFRQQEAVLVGGFPDLADVDPESGDFQEIVGVTDEESTYTLGQKGNLLTITRKTIINDDVSIVQRLVKGLSRTARRTHGKYVWAFFIDNATCSDGTAWFTGGHGNLGAAALTHATALVGYKALAATTEKDSGERLGLLDDPDVKPVIVGPIDIMETIQQIESEDFYYSANDLTTKVPNPLKGKVRGKVLSLLTDADDWGMLLPPNAIDMVEMGYLNGREEPELFVADSPQSEQVFVADKVRYKLRHEYAGALIDFRSGYKAEVP